MKEYINLLQRFSDMQQEMSAILTIQTDIREDVAEEGEYIITAGGDHLHDFLEAAEDLQSEIEEIILSLRDLEERDRVLDAEERKGELSYA